MWPDKQLPGSATEKPTDVTTREVDGEERDDAEWIYELLMGMRDPRGDPRIREGITGDVERLIKGVLHRTPS